MLEYRVHDRAGGRAGPLVFALHGGPGAPGSVGRLADGLADRFRVIEPFQRRSGGEPLTVARHVDDLDELVGALARPAASVVIVGSSWGAMLALAWAAAHSDRAVPLVLVGCGTFDTEARAAYERRVDARLDAETRRRLERLEREIEDPDQRLAAQGRALLPVYSVDPLPVGDEEDPLTLRACDAAGHRESWADMLRLQADGTYPQSFRAVRGPVLMLHGDEDPHPGAAIRAGLAPFLPGLEYVSWPSCGHYPWLERGVRGAFFDVLNTWLEAAGSGSSGVLRGA